MKAMLLAMAVFTLAAIPTVSAKESRVVTLTTNNLIVLKDVVTDETVSPIILKLMTMPGDSVTFYINSPGGSIMAGFQLIQAMKSSGKTTICVAEFAASMAFSIFQACDVRYILPGSLIMQHQASYGGKGSISEMKTQMELVEKLVYKLNFDDATRLEMDIEEFKKRVHNDWWMFDLEILGNKAADDQVLARCSPSLSMKTETQTIDSLFGTIVLEWSGCPLVSYPLAVKMDRKAGVSDQDFKTWVESLELNRDWKTVKKVKDSF